MDYIAAVWLTGGGAFFLLVSLGILLCQSRFKQSRTPVRLVVVDTHPSTGEDGKTYIHCEYMITSGPHSGLKKTSGYGTYPPLHNKGEHVDGYLDTKTGEVQSSREGRLTRWIIFGFAGLGLAMLAFSLHFGLKTF